jgi:hypothetical protein
VARKRRRPRRPADDEAASRRRRGGAGRGRGGAGAAPRPVRLPSRRRGAAAGSPRCRGARDGRRTPSWSSGSPPPRGSARPGGRTHGERRRGVAGAARRLDAPHREGEPAGERVRRVLRRQAAGRAAGPRDPPHADRGPGPDRGLAAAPRRRAAARLPRIPASGARDDPPATPAVRLRRAPPPGRRGGRGDDPRSFTPDHRCGAGQTREEAIGGLSVGRGSGSSAGGDRKCVLLGVVPRDEQPGRDAEAVLSNIVVRKAATGRAVLTTTEAATPPADHGRRMHRSWQECAETPPLRPEPCRCSMAVCAAGSRTVQLP